MLLVSEGKESLKKILPSGLQGMVRDTLPTSPAQLPAIIITSLECQEASVGIGDMIGTTRQDMIETGRIKGARMVGVFQFDLWALKSDTGLEEIESRGNEIMEAISIKKTELWQEGFLKISLSLIEMPETVAGGEFWKDKQDAWRRGIDYRVIYEKTFTEGSEETISQVVLNVDGKYKEQLSIERLSLAPVPRLLEAGTDEAIQTLTQAGFVTGGIQQERSLLPGGTIIRQYPSPGSQVPVESPIKLVVSSVLLTSQARTEGKGAYRQEFMIDGKLDRSEYATHYWSVPNTYLQISLDKMSMIGEIRTLLLDKDDRFYQYKIEVSEDGQTWRSAVDKTTGEHRGWQADKFDPPTRALYVRTTGTYSSVQKGLHVVEQEIYGIPEPGEIPELGGSPE